MKIAYLITKWDLSQEHGVLKKIALQIRTWAGAGHEVRLFALPPNRQIWDGIADLSIDVEVTANQLQRFLRSARLVGRILDWQPDLVYSRFDLALPGFRRLFKTVPTVLELNGDDIGELRSIPGHSKILLLYKILSRDLVLNYARGMVAVTNELSQAFSGYPAAHLVLANGINLTDFPQLLPAKGERPRLVFIGSAMLPWHGIDKIIWLAGQKSAWDFDIIGLSAGDIGATAPENITFHGTLSKQEYLPLMERADVALGTLAPRRGKKDEVCSLKIREYLAYGLPVINGCRDTDFPNPVPFFLELPNTEDNVHSNLDRIEKFVQAWRGKRVPRNAVQHLDQYEKEKKRLAFLEQIASQ